MCIARMFALVFLVAILPLPLAQSHGGVDQRYDAKRCKAKLVGQATHDKPGPIRVRKGEKHSGFDPIVAFTILESGNVIDASRQT